MPRVWARSGTVKLESERFGTLVGNSVMAAGVPLDARSG